MIPDELLFLVMHQTQELWLKCAVFEATNAVEHLAADLPFAALGSLDRVVHIAQILRDQIRVLGSLSPAQFQVIRRSLGNGSGLESPGYNQFLAAAAAAAPAGGRLVHRSPRHPRLHRPPRDPRPLRPRGRDAGVSPTSLSMLKLGIQDRRSLRA